MMDKKEKRIKAFFDVMGTTNGLIHDYENPSKENQIKINTFFQNLKKLETVTEATLDLTLVTSLDKAEARDYCKRLAAVFKANGAERRLKACCCQDGVLQRDGSVRPFESSSFKFQMVSEYGEKHESIPPSPEDILFCIYAGDSAEDEWMAENHIDSKHYGNVPYCFIDTKTNESSYTCHKGKQIGHKKITKSNYEAISQSLECIIEIRSQKTAAETDKEIEK